VAITTSARDERVAERGLQQPASSATVTRRRCRCRPRAASREVQRVRVRAQGREQLAADGEDLASYRPPSIPTHDGGKSWSSVAALKRLTARPAPPAGAGSRRFRP
jgi:hypothetical protein